MEYLAWAYYVTVEAGTRKFSKVPKKYREAVRVLLEADMLNGVITEEEYNRLISQ